MITEPVPVPSANYPRLRLSARPLSQALGWGFPAERLAWTVVEFDGDGVPASCGTLRAANPIWRDGFEPPIKAAALRVAGSLTTGQG